MEFKKIIPIIVLTGILFISCKDSKITPDTTITAAKKANTSTVKKEIPANNLQTVNFAIEGMTCAVGCAKTIQEKLTHLDGVQKATVDFDKKWATVIFDKTVHTPETLIKVIQATGDGKTYKASSIKF